MITEDYVSFETAKLLKEKGFNYPCRVVYSPKGIVKHYLKEEAYAHQLKGHKKLCPTLQIAMKWLREEKGIAVVPILSSVLDNKSFLWDIEITVAKTNESYHQGWIYESYEKVCEAAILYCLKNLI